MSPIHRLTPPIRLLPLIVSSACIGGGGDLDKSYVCAAADQSGACTADVCFLPRDGLTRERPVTITRFSAWAEHEWLGSEDKIGPIVELCNHSGQAMDVTLEIAADYSGGADHVVYWPAATRRLLADPGCTTFDYDELGAPEIHDLEDNYGDYESRLHRDPFEDPEDVMQNLSTSTRPEQVYDDNTIRFHINDDAINFHARVTTAPACDSCGSPAQAPSASVFQVVGRIPDDGLDFGNEGALEAVFGGGENDDVTRTFPNICDFDRGATYCSGLDEASCDTVRQAAPTASACTLVSAESGRVCAPSCDRLPADDALCGSRPDCKVEGQSCANDCDAVLLDYNDDDIAGADERHLFRGFNACRNLPPNATFSGIYCAGNPLLGLSDADIAAHALGSALLNCQLLGDEGTGLMVPVAHCPCASGICQEHEFGSQDDCGVADGQ